jgi:hypothetical protein
MLPGPIFIYHCPKCDNQIYNESVASGNTFGAVLYSDGKAIKPNYPDYPTLTKCSKCNTIFWLNKSNETGAYNMNPSLNEKLKNIEKARFLNVYEYCDAIESILFNTKMEEKNLRLEIWWCFNDRDRKGEQLFSSEADKLIWNKNALILIELLDANDINQKISIAELYRNLGNFEKCQEILNCIETSDFDWLKEAFEKECENKNTKVFRLK